MAWFLALAASASQGCAPDFPYQAGWLGGDAAYSLPLLDGSSLWLFGDTFVGAPGAKDRRGAVMIANSVARSECRGGAWRIAYHWRGGEKPGAFFDTGLPDVRYWPLDAFLYKRRAYVALSRIRMKGTGPFDFENVGTDLAVLDPKGADPTRWTVSISTLWPTGEAHLGVSIVAQGARTLLYSVDAREGKPKRVVLARLSPLEYLARGGAWKPGFSLEDAATVMGEGATEMTVRRHGERWVAVYPAPGLPSPGVAVRTAPTPEGPWSEPRILADYGAKPDAEVFCYAAKEHVQLARRGQLLVTHACNAFKPERLFSDLELYRPRARSLPLP